MKMTLIEQIVALQVECDALSDAYYARHENQIFWGKRVARDFSEITSKLSRIENLLKLSDQDLVTEEVHD